MFCSTDLHSQHSIFQPDLEGSEQIETRLPGPRFLQERQKLAEEPFMFSTNYLVRGLHNAATYRQFSTIWGNPSTEGLVPHWISISSQTASGKIPLLPKDPAWGRPCALGPSTLQGPLNNCPKVDPMLTLFVLSRNARFGLAAFSDKIPARNGTYNYLR